MRGLWYLVFLWHSVLAGNLYNPVSYEYPAASPFIAPQPISSLHLASPLRTSTGYGPLAAARVASPVLVPPPAPAVVGSPVLAKYAAPVTPVVTKYAAPIFQKYAAIPQYTDIPITRYEARPGFIQKYVDVAHPKLATSKIQIRRPAIQKHFYDIEERIVVRPIASAVVELDQPISKTQSGPTLVSPALATAPGIVHAPIHAVPHPVYGLPPAPTYGPPPTGSQDQYEPPSAPENPQYPPPSAPQNPQYPPPSAPQGPQFPPSAPQNPQFPPQNPQFPPPSAPQNPQFPPPSAPQNPQFPPPSAPQNPGFPEVSAPDSNQESDDSDSITVENEEVRARSLLQQQQQQQQPPQARQFQPIPMPQQRSQQQTAQMAQPQAQARSGPASFQSQTQTEARFLSRSQNSADSVVPQSRSFTEDVIPSSRAILTEEQSQSNQQRLIELLTGRGGVAEVKSGISIESAAEAGQIRGTVLSVTPAPPSGPADERVSTRRVVVSRPIQTLQEVDVVQPFTKLQRLSIQQPALLKTPRVDIARLKTFSPVPVTNYASYGPYTYLH